jgi:hypothetical protein
MLSFSSATGNNLFLEEVQSRREATQNLNVLNLSYAKNTSNSADLISMQVNPFAAVRFPLRNFALRFNYTDYNKGEFYANKNYEMAFVYNIINHELLTLYLNYAIYSMYSLRFYDFNLDQEASAVAHGNSWSVGVDIKLYNSWYLLAEKRWVKVEKNYIKNLDSFYLGLKYKISLKILKES